MTCDVHAYVAHFVFEGYEVERKGEVRRDLCCVCTFVNKGYEMESKMRCTVPCVVYVGVYMLVHEGGNVFPGVGPGVMSCMPMLSGTVWPLGGVMFVHAKDFWQCLNVPCFECWMVWCHRLPLGAGQDAKWATDEWFVSALCCAWHGVLTMC